MNVSLRALSWATRFFWIIALAFAVTCAYSATLIRGNFGEPIVDYTGEGLAIGLPASLDNRGYYTIADLTVQTVITNSDGIQISEDTSYVGEIPPQENATIFHNMTLSVNTIAAESDYLFNDSSLTLYGALRLNYADLIPFELTTNRTIPWGAPLFNFTVGAPRFSPHNSTHLRTVVPITFQNHSPYFPVVGVIRIEIFDNEDQQFGSASTFVDVPSNASYDGQISISAGRGATSEGVLRAYIETAAFSFGPMVINYG
jgi:hypothetical protein